MRILILGPQADTLWRYRRDLALELKGRGHEVVFSAPEPDPATLEALGAAGCGFHPVALRRAGMNPLRDLGFILSLRKTVREIRPDLLFLITVKPVLYGSLAFRFSGAPRLVSMLTGIGSLFMGNSLPRTLVRSAAKALFRFGLPRNQKVLFQNPEDLQLFTGERLVARDRAVLVAGSGVNLEEYPFRPPPEGPPVFLFLGRLLRDKGVREFVEAARILKASHPQASFAILGPTDPNPASVGEAEIHGWTKGGAVEYRGSKPDVRPDLSACSVLVLPSYYREGIPRSILEALATGRAVVTTDMPGCRETVREGGNGFLVPPKDVKALARTMERFVTDPSLVPRMGKASRRMAEERFDVRMVNAVVLKALLGA